jgi:hypothetical protein
MRPARLGSRCCSITASAARWLQDFMDEVCSFPAAPHDDIVDALSEAINYLERENDLGNRLDALYDARAINYRGAINDAGGHWGIAAGSLGMSVAEFQRAVEESDEHDGGNLNAEYEYWLQYYSARRQNNGFG